MGWAGKGEPVRAVRLCLLKLTGVTCSESHRDRSDSWTLLAAPIYLAVEQCNDWTAGVRARSRIVLLVFYQTLNEALLQTH